MSSARVCESPWRWAYGRGCNSPTGSLHKRKRWKGAGGVCCRCPTGQCKGRGLARRDVARQGKSSLCCEHESPYFVRIVDRRIAAQSLAEERSCDDDGPPRVEQGAWTVAVAAKGRPHEFISERRLLAFFPPAGIGVRSFSPRRRGVCVTGNRRGGECGR